MDTEGMKHPKTPEARAAEVRHLASQLAEVGLPEEVTRPVTEAMRAFQESGQGFSESVRVEGTPLVLVCLLSNQAHITSHIRITRRLQGQPGGRRPVRR